MPWVMRPTAKALSLAERIDGILREPELLARGNRKRFVHLSLPRFMQISPELLGDGTSSPRRAAWPANWRGLAGGW